jgi:hypothetical protein
MTGSPLDDLLLSRRAFVAAGAALAGGFAFAQHASSLYLYPG